MAHRDQPSLLQEFDDGVLVLTLNRPERRNALDRELTGRLSDALQAADTDAGVRVVVITGAGSSFCAGMDLTEFAARTGKWESAIGSITRAARATPLIAALNGPAVAGGCELALACDLRVAAMTCHFSLPEVMRGLVAAEGGLLRLPQLIPPGVAAELALTGAPLDARRGYELGLVNRVVEAEEVLAVARELAGRICAAAPLAVAASLQILRMGGATIGADAWSRQDELAAAVIASDDAIEGARAFVAHRPPVWRNS